MEKKLIKVRVMPKARVNKVREEEDSYKIYTTVTPEKDKANRAAIKLLAKFLNKKISSLTILKGLHSRNKIIQID